MQLGAIEAILLFTAASAIVYFVVRSKAHTAGSGRDKSNKWTAWAGAIVTFAAGATWYQNNGVDIDELIYQVLITLLPILLIVYVSTRLYFSETVKSSSSTTNKINQTESNEASVSGPNEIELSTYQKAYDEILSGNIDKSVWAYCYANSANDEEAKKKYVLMRQREILKEFQEIKEEESIALTLREEELNDERQISINQKLDVINTRKNDLEMIISDLQNNGICITERTFAGGWKISFPSGNLVKMDNFPKLQDFYVEIMKKIILNSADE